MTARHVALTIAGSDSGGGAGIQADLKTFHAFGVFGTSAITAITAQNTVGVRSIQKIEPDVVADQIRAVADDLKPAAAKTGMLADAPIIEAVASAIRETGLAHLVVDPVMVAKSGDRLLEEDAVNALAMQLLPLSEVLTPNLPEAAILAGRRVETVDDMRAAAEILADRGAQSVLVKGGHLSGDVLIDLFFDGADWHEWQERRHDTRHTHGTGCTLSAAICAGLALGWPRVEAVEKARLYTQRAIETAPELGEGHGPLNHWAGVGSSGFGDSGNR
ncbi:MAG: bifunctional hydroxymethylpyrimidine kinase/phosphomethylpyrimidine kinase [Gemmatimonadota bacterium]|nr:MAG: bifunctional hydroxymethylpyrimidine kinase/phosphomethylpyrimidine kinase [Gemmatimonadota bacterium]